MSVIFIAILDFKDMASDSVCDEAARVEAEDLCFSHCLYPLPL